MHHPVTNMSSIWIDIKKDIQLNSWISKYRQTSVKYMLVMLCFYYGIGTIISASWTNIIGNFIPSYSQQEIVRSLIPVITAGSFEESLFFGIPFYLFNNNIVVLSTGVIWSTLHLFNTNNFDIMFLSYGNWLFTLITLFFSLRTWISGRGWFSIISHTVWNVTFFLLGCQINPETNSICSYTFIDKLQYSDISSIASAVILLLITILIMQIRKKKLF